jgi:hypothetical protein
VSSKKTTAPAEKDDAIVDLLRKSYARPPVGFALRAAARFQAEAEAAQLRRSVRLFSIFFAIASLGAWVFLLNVQDATAAFQYGIAVAVSLMRSILVIWDNIPLSCGTAVAAMSCALLLCGGILAKLGRINVLVK